MSFDARSAIKIAACAVISVVLVVIIGMHLGVPRDPEGFLDRARELDAAARQGVEIDDLLRSGGGSYVESSMESRAIRFYILYYAIINAILIIAARVRLRDVLLVHSIVALIFYFWLGWKYSAVSLGSALIASLLGVLIFGVPKPRPK